MWAEELKMLLSDYDASEDDFRALMKRANGSRTAIQREIVDVRFGVRELITEEEWNSIRKAMLEKAEEERKKKEDKDK